MKRWAVASLVLAVATSLALLVVPVYTSGSGGTATLIEVNGTRAVFPLIVPVLLALAPVIRPRRAAAIASASLLGAFVLVSGGSVGLFYLPALVAMIVAACRAAPGGTT